MILTASQFRSYPRRLQIAQLLGAALCLLWLLPAATAAEKRNPIRTLIDRADIAVRTDPETSRRDAEQTLLLLARTPDADLEIETRLILCDYQSERDSTAAEEQIALMEQLLPRATRRGLRSGVLNCQGEIAETAGNNDKAMQLYEQAVAAATDAGDDKMLANALFSRGYLRGLQAQYTAGLVDLKRSKAIYERIGQPQHALTALNGIAILYNRMGDFDQARQMYLQTLKAQRDAKLLREEGVTLHNLGRAYENLHDWGPAQQAFQESLQISRDLNYPRGEAYALRGLAAVENGLNHPRAALEILERAQTLQRQTPDARLEAQINLARGIALHQLEQLPASANALEDALQVFRQAASLYELRTTYKELAAVYAGMGNWRTAYGYLDKASETAENQFRNQIDQRFASLKVEFDTAAKEKENALLMRENAANQKTLAEQARSRHLQAIVILLTVVLAGVLLGLALHQRRTSLRMRSLAMTDELTGVPNRRAVLGRLQPLVQAADRVPCAVLIIDIDHFKSINDQHGHAEGDAALKLVAAGLSAGVADRGFVGRMGGEEFIAVLPGCELTQAVEVAEQIRTAVMSIDSLHWLADRRITVSIGVTVCTQAGESSSLMLQRADAALYEAKRGGRNCVKVTPPPAASTGSTLRGGSDVESGSVEYA